LLTDPLWPKWSKVVAQRLYKGSLTLSVKGEGESHLQFGARTSKIRLDVLFGMSDSRFTKPNTQNRIDHISESAQGESKKQQDEDSQTVISQVRGNIQVRNGISAISNASFDVPGAHATVRGTYNLLNQRVDLQGTLDTKGNLSDATTGFKALVVKAITPLFKKQKSVRIVPFQITGAYGNTSVGIDWKRQR